MKIIFVCLLLFTCLAAHAETWTYRSKGDFQFESGPTIDEVRGLKADSISFGEMLKVDMHFSLVNRKSGQHTIAGSFKFQNTADKMLFYILSIVFFDEDMQVVTVENVESFLDRGINPKSNFRFNSGANLPTDTYKHIKSYQAVIYVSDTVFQKF